MDTRSSTRGSLLVAEDNATNQALVRAILKAAGYEVSVVGNGIEAIEAHMTGKFDAILMDCHMPAMDGFHATGHIREREVELQLKRVPIIALTGDSVDEARDACLHAGMDDFLTKPYDRAKLAEVLSRWLCKNR